MVRMTQRTDHAPSPVAVHLQLAPAVLYLVEVLAARDGLAPVLWMEMAIADCAQAGAESLAGRVQRAMYLGGAGCATD